MLKWTLVFFVFSLVAGIFGFSGLANTSADMARIFFFIFIVLFLFSIVGGMLNGGGKSLNKLL